ncbi:unnamed protein product [Colias eurytheme]|nr:unnamed protein product [Colias eurytheme]
MERVTLYEEYKLIQKNDTEVYGIWKGAHLLLFFLAFVFGSFCTFCFHMLMYLFDEKCVLFPKLLSLTSLRQNIIYEFIPEDKDMADMLPVDFVSTQWVEKSVCYLPTYVPLVSGIFGLVWTTMFLMCSSGSRVLTGLQRPWRILPPVFIFSLAMGSLCLYSSIVTHYGLHDLCLKLSEITGSTTCTYTVNVATLVYERRIRGVYQATQLTILSAWLHTACWILSALLTLARVLLVVDFQLVRVRTELTGNIDRFLERNEMHIRTISPDVWDSQIPRTPSRGSVRVHFQKKEYLRTKMFPEMKMTTLSDTGELLYLSATPQSSSVLALVPSEQRKLDKLSIYGSIHKDHHFIVKLLYNIVNAITGNSPLSSLTSSEESLMSDTGSMKIARQYGQEKISSKLNFVPPSQRTESQSIVSLQEAEEVAQGIRLIVKSKLHTLLEQRHPQYQSTLNLPSEIAMDTINTNISIAPTPITRQNHEKSKETDLAMPGTSKDAKNSMKSSLKNTGTQTRKRKESHSQRVHIDSKTSMISSISDETESVEKETQTPKKEKQD